MGTAQEMNNAGAGAAPALCFKAVSFRYRADGPLVLEGFDLNVRPGEILAVVGGNGSGKSTMARLSNGLLAPEHGEVLVDDISTSDPDRQWDVRSRVGLLFQDPEDQIVGASVEDDVAFGLENLGVPREEMRLRVADVLQAVGLDGEERTEPHLLSGGQKQRLALAGVLVLDPSVLVLDEPTSMLDPAGREEISAFIRGLAERGVAVVLITQHMGEALRADRLLALSGGAAGYVGSPARFFTEGASVAFPVGLPPALALARRVGVGAGVVTEDEVVAALAGALVDARTGACLGGDRRPGLDGTLARDGRPAGDGTLARDRRTGLEGTLAPDATRQPDQPPFAAELHQASVIYNQGTFLQREALRDVEVRIATGAVTAVVGATASGKSTLLQLIAGLVGASSGTVQILGAGRAPAGAVGMVFQRPETQLFKSTVWDDVAVAPRLQGLDGSALEARVEAALLAVGLDPGAFGERMPHGLSVGEQRRVALAGVLSLDPRLLVLDEPGAALDPPAREALMGRLGEWAHTRGRTLVFSSHDMDEVATRADRVIVLHRGRVAAEGATRDVLAHRDLLESVGLRPPLAARVAERLGAEPREGIVDGGTLCAWLEGRGVPPADGGTPVCAEGESS
ncbi:MAG: ABC transporter ATP-binding protein [Thermoleophilia bacterium]